MRFSTKLGCDFSLKSKRRRSKKNVSSYQVLEPRKLLAADFVISEFLASNDSVIQDDNGNFSDYIEIYNAGTSSGSLSGFSLTDDPTDISKWTFPAVNLDAGEFLLVFAGADSDPASGTDLYTGFGLSAAGEYVGLYDDNGNVLSEFGPQGTDFPPQETDVTFGLAFDTPPPPVGETLIGRSPSQGNGSFEDLTGGTPDQGGNRIGGNSDAQIPGWFADRLAGFIGWDDDVAASHGSEYAFVNNQDRAIFTSDPVNVNLVAGERLQLTFDVATNEVGSQVTYRASLQFGSGGNTSFSDRDIVTANTDFQELSFNHTVSAAQAGANTVSIRIDLDNTTGGIRDQAYFDDVQLQLFDATAALGGVWASLENFDSVTAPSLPTGWSNSSSGASSWSTSNVGAADGTNRVFVPNPSSASTAELTSPSFSVTEPTSRIRFQNSYSTEAGFDGGTLQISIAGGSFVDILTAGGSFISGGYNDTIGGTAAWSGDSGGYIETQVQLPNSANGNSVQLRWRFTSDAIVGGDNWSIDSLEQIEAEVASLVQPLEEGSLLAPTPGFANTGLRPGQVLFSQSSQLFSSSFQLTLTPERAGEEVRYTVDGSVPDTSSLLYTGPINISASTEIRALAVSAAGQSGAVFGETYELLDSSLTSFTSNLPILVFDNYGAGNPLNRNFNTTFFAAIEPDPVTGVASLTDATSVATRGATHRRGSSSFTLGKNSFRIELRDQTDEDESHSVLGLPSESDFVLNTLSRFDRAQVRNPIAFDTNRQVDVYAPNYRYVEVFFNQDGDALEESDYFGTYLFQESIKRDSNRVDIADLDPTDDTPTTDLLGNDPITGGYIVRGDRNQAGDPAFDTTRGNPSTERFVIHTPNDLTTNQRNYIEDYFNATEEDFIDVDSFIDQHIFQTFWKGPDALRFSTYFHKDRGGKLRAGPNWDQERIAGVETDTSINRARNPENWYGDGSVTSLFEHDWWDRLFDDPNFMQRWIDRLDEFGGTIYNSANLNALIDGYVEQLQGTNPLDSPIVRNYIRWGASASNGSSGNNNTGGEAWPNARVQTSSDPNSNGFYQFADPSITAGVTDPANSPTPQNILAYWQSEISHVRNWVNARVSWIYDQLSDRADFSIEPSLVAEGTGVNLVIPGTVASNAQVWYTLDGSDPRDSADGNKGNPSPSAILWDGNPITLNASTEITVRILDSTIANPKNQVNGQSNSFDIWSGETRGLFEVGIPVADALRITEINYNPSDPTAAEISAYAAATGVSVPVAQVNLDSDDFEFIEVQNTSTTNALLLNGTQFSDGVTLAFENVTLLVEDIDAFEARYGTTGIQVLGQWSGGLSDGGETISITDNQGVEVLSVSYDDVSPWDVSADGDGATLELIDPVNTPANELGKYYRWQASSEFGGTPGRAFVAPSGVVINEVLAHTDLSVGDSIELFNPTGSSIDISGWHLSDSGSNLFKYQIPANTVLAAGQYVVFTENDFNPTPGVPGPNDFALSSTGDEVYLTRQDNGVAVFEDVVDFGATFNGESLGRLPNGTGRLTRLASNSFGNVNGDAEVGPLVISEVNYHPEDPRSAALAIDPTLTDNDLEFIEIANPTSSTIDLTNWRLRGESDYDFAAGTSLAAGAALIVVSFDPSSATNALKLSGFREHYNIGSEVTIVGGFSGSLSNSTGRISLQQPDAPDSLGEIPHVVVDELIYDDLSPWPDADGTGQVLERDDLFANGNFATSWIGAAATPGEFESQFLLGDADQNGVVDFADIPSFIAILQAGTYLEEADINGDGVVDFADIPGFIQLLINQ